ncbi:unnamed protein product [Microthlaspi erraticum]|uniref:Uncharacterized protein n=1 Tax=Microthlaspi erraticum TaxID=1685480 RepID=A0A6D2JVF1_9BRAS|nr:unnamed protein product [Microthlaspi erraticum]
MGTAQNIQRDDTASSQLPQEATNANAAGVLIHVASQQPDSPPTEFWEQLMIALGQIQSNTEQLLKLITDAQTNVVGSRKRTRQERAQVRDDKEEAETLRDQNQPRKD